MALALVSCSSQKSRVHEKQRTASDIKIDSLDINKGQMKLRFEYRSYIPKQLQSLDCETSFSNNSIVFKQQLKPEIKLESFATEIFTINFDKTERLMPLTSLKQIDYGIHCESIYDKGREFLQKSSILYQVPASDFFYR